MSKDDEIDQIPIRTGSKQVCHPVLHCFTEILIPFLDISKNQFRGQIAWISNGREYQTKECTINLAKLKSQIVTWSYFINLAFSCFRS
jgi:molybdopterin/thiamine biosynthesis adenylyltransferase